MPTSGSRTTTYPTTEALVSEIKEDDKGGAGGGMPGGMGGMY